MNSYWIIDLYRRLMCRKRLYRFNKALFFLGQKGMGIGNWESPRLSGEYDFLRRFAAYVNDPVVFDVGANIGKYSELLKSFSPGAVIYAFEPHPRTFGNLEIAAKKEGFIALNVAVGDSVGTATLYDHEDRIDDLGTEHASLLQDVIENMHGSRSASWEVPLTTVDRIMADRGVDHIDLLKIDVEGAEMNVLKGAKGSLQKGMIDLIHFEFNETNTISRVFMKDFFVLLHNYAFYRMLPDGLVPLGSYFAPVAEIFVYQNIVAVRNGVDTWL